MNMLRLFIFLTLICGVLYPGIVTVIGQVAFSEKALGSLIKNGEKIIGSSLLAQKFSGAGYFHPRPSAADYATVSSGASHSSPTQKAGTELRLKRMADEPDAGVDAWTASGSGLDPHISPKTAFSQVQRVAAARGVSTDDLEELVAKHIEGPSFGIWGQDRVNVLELNIALLEGKHGNTRPTSGIP